MGVSEEDAQRPIIGILNAWNEMNPGHYPFREEANVMRAKRAGMATANR